MESLFTQFWLLEIRKDADYVFGRYFAGESQLPLGNRHTHRVDVTTSRRSEDGTATILEFVNYHSLLYHRDSRHLPYCHLRRRGNQEGTTPSFSSRRAATARLDEMKVEYAEALTKASYAHGHPLRVEYKKIWECEVFCPKSVAGFPNLRVLLRVRHPEASVLGVGNLRSITQERLLRRVLERPDNSSGKNDWSGLAVVCGGREESGGEDFPDELMGFCMQRSPIRAEDITPYTREQALKFFEGDERRASAYLDAQVGKLQTVSRRSFPENGTVVSLELLKWLIQFRKLEGFTIKHLLFYRCEKVGKRP